MSPDAACVRVFALRGVRRLVADFWPRDKRGLSDRSKRGLWGADECWFINVPRVNIWDCELVVSRNELVPFFAGLKNKRNVYMERNMGYLR